jgi:hypothetical protein
MSFTLQVQDVNLVETVVTPPVDHAALLQEDQQRIEEGWDGPLRFAYPHYTMLDFTSAASLDLLSGGGRIWRLRVVSEGAYSLNFGFTTFQMPPGATLHLYPTEQDPNNPIWEGPYTAADAVEGEFWTPVIPGDDVTIEVYVPASATTEPHLVLAQINHDYRGFLKGGDESSPGSCNIDIKCPQADPWRDEARSAGTYTLNGAWTCSGQLINSLTDPKPPYFLTAYHCGISSANDQTVVVYWKKESPNCGDLCCGPLNYHQSGSILRARYSPSDVCLVELAQEPDPSFEVYYAGWDAREDWRPQECTAIHHPGTVVKTISFNYDPLQVTSYLGYSSPGNGTHWRVDDWEEATTEPGSSGSAIWDENHHIVGQLHGGYASCTSITSDWYGRFSVSWVGGGSSTNSLRPWLDPNNTGTLVLDGYDPFGSSAANEPGLQVRHALLSRVDPNPASGPVRVAFTLPQAGRAALEIIDVAGRVVSRVAERDYQAGAHETTWNGLSSDGRPVPPGVYFVRLKVDGRTADSRKVVWLR